MRCEIVNATDEKFFRFTKIHWSFASSGKENVTKSYFMSIDLCLFIIIFHWLASMFAHESSHDAMLLMQYLIDWSTCPLNHSATSSLLVNSVTLIYYLIKLSHFFILTNTVLISHTMYTTSVFTAGYNQHFSLKIEFYLI